MTRTKPRPATGSGISNLSFAGIVLAMAVGLFLLVLNLLPAGPDASATPRPPFVEVEAAPRRATLSCAVASITDGDSLRCADGVRIRLHAVAAREADGRCAPGHPCTAASADAARRELSRLARGRTLQCEPTGRSYGRITAICWTPEGVELNCAMVRSGAAALWDRFDRRQRICRP